MARPIAMTAPAASSSSSSSSPSPSSSRPASSTKSRRGLDPDSKPASTTTTASHRPANSGNSVATRRASPSPDTAPRPPSKPTTTTMPRTAATSRPPTRSRDGPPTLAPAITTSTPSGALGLTGVGPDHAGPATSSARSASASPAAQHTRSLSVKSQASEVFTDGGSSSGRDSLFPSTRKPRSNGSFRIAGVDGGDSIPSLGRSGSSASTVPTSPDVEPTTSRPPQARMKATGNGAGAGVVGGGDGLESFAAQKQNALRNLEEQHLASQLPGEGIHRPDAAWSKELPTINSVGDITHLSASSSASSNLDKPLPPLRPEDISESGSSREILVTSPVPSKASSKTTLKSAFASSGKYFRNSSSLWSHSHSAKNTNGLTAPSLEASPNPSKSGTNSTGPSPQRSHVDLAATFKGRAGGAASAEPEATQPQAPSSRPHSPFLFRKRSKSNLLDPNSSESDHAKAKTSPSSSSYFSLRKTTRQSTASSISAHDDGATSSSTDALDTQDPLRTQQVTQGNPSSMPIGHAGSFRSRPSSRVGPEKVAFHRPSLRRDRSRSVGEMEMLLNADAHSKQHASTAASSSSTLTTTSHRHSASTVTSPRTLDGRGLSPTPPNAVANPFQLPPIATSPDGLFLVDEEAGGATQEKPKPPTKSPSFRWSRVLSKRGSQSGRKKSHDIAVTEAATATATSSAVPSGAASRASDNTRRTSLTTHGGPSASKRGSDASTGTPAVAADPSSPSQRPSRNSIVQGSKEAQTELTPNHLGVSGSGSRHRRNSSNSSQRSPLSPNLASLWTSAVALDSDDEELGGGTRYHDASSQPLSPEVPTKDVPSVEAQGDVPSVGTTSPPPTPSHSRRGSLGRALSTMFDLKPSLEEHGALPQMPPVPPMPLHEPPPPPPPHPRHQRATAASATPALTSKSQTTNDVKTPPRSISVTRRSVDAPVGASAAPWQAASNHHSRAVSGASTASASQTMMTAKSSMTSLYDGRGNRMPVSTSSRSLQDERGINKASQFTTGHTRRVTAPGGETTGLTTSSLPPGVRAAELAHQRARGASANGSTVATSTVAAKKPPASASSTSVVARTTKLSNATPAGTAKTTTTTTITATPTTRTRRKSTASLKSLENALGSVTAKAIPPRGSSQSSKQRKSSAAAASAASEAGASAGKHRSVSASSSLNSLPGASSVLSSAAPTAHRRSKSRPTLLVDTNGRRPAGGDAGTAQRRGSASASIVPRPSSSMGLYGLGGDAKAKDKTSSATLDSAGNSAFARKLSQPHMQEMDDKAFLALLEDTRRKHREKAAKQQEDADRIARMAQMGMAPNRKMQQSRRRQSGAGLRGGEREDVRGPSIDSKGDVSRTSSEANAAGNTSLVSVGSTCSSGRTIGAAGAVRHRSSSADGRLGGPSLAALRRSLGAEASEGGEDEDESAVDLVHEDQSPGGPAGAGSFNVGKASAHLSNAFANDDDWKREVRALFVIRELLNTEQSYARHLETLLQAVRRKAINAPSSSNGTSSHARRKSMAAGSLSNDVGLASSSSSSSPSSSSASAGDRHLPLMRNLLPQLIALSRSLSARIDGNPTAAGVGTAFSVIAPQLEATFVAWSAAASEIMASLRHSQGPKGKAKDKLILVADDGAGAGDVGGAGIVRRGMSQSQPPSPRKMRPAGEGLRANSPEVSRGPTKVKSSSPSSASSSAAKRRSTISYGSGVGFEGVSETGILTGGGGGNAGSAAATPTPTTPSRPTSPWGFASATKRSIAAAAAASRPHTLTKKLTSSASSFDLSAKQSAELNATAAAATSASASSATGTSFSPSPRKALSVLDVAIMPMQRPPRYLLLLTELVRNTPVDSVSHARVVRSLNLIKGIAGKCDAASAQVAGR